MGDCGRALREGVGPGEQNLTVHLPSGKQGLLQQQDAQYMLASWSDTQPTQSQGHDQASKLLLCPPWT
jgi:hypothetical protein